MPEDECTVTQNDYSVEESYGIGSPHSPETNTMQEDLTLIQSPEQNPEGDPEETTSDM